MNEYKRIAGRLLGGLLVLALCAALLPAGAVYAAGDTYAMEEDSTYAVGADTLMRLRRAAPRGVQDNVTMHLFDYDGSLNQYGGRVLTFCNSAGQNSKDGTLQKSDDRPVMAPTLENGWPKVLGVSGPTAEDRSGSLQYLFDPGMAVAGKDVYAVGRGGSTGLFQRDGEGYLYYDSLQNAASYDAADGRFRLGNYLLRPNYTTYVTPNGKTAEQDYTQAFNGNFFHKKFRCCINAVGSSCDMLQGIYAYFLKSYS